MRLSITVMLFGGVFLIPLDAFADSSDDTLMFYLSKSDLVVLGKVTKESGPVFTEEGVPNYICEFEIADVLKGDRTMKGTSISVNIMRFEADKKDHNPLIGRNSECILFLNKQSHSSVPVWVTADFCW